MELLSGGNVVKRTPVQSGGEFHVTVAAGTYELALAGTSVCHGRATVKPHAKTSVVIVCA